MAVLAYRGVRGKAFKLPQYPQDRHNGLDFNAVTTFFKYEGRVLNPCQKPIDLMQFLISRHLAPGSTVLSLGSGSGTDAIAALASGMNVIAVEGDEKQFLGGRYRIRAWVAQQLEPKPVGKGKKSTFAADDAEPSPELSKEGKEEKKEDAEEGPSQMCAVCGGRNSKDDPITSCVECGAKIHTYQYGCHHNCAECTTQRRSLLFCLRMCHDKHFETLPHILPKSPLKSRSEVIFSLFDSYVFDFVILDCICKSPLSKSYIAQKHAIP
jgi:hypothetical protein